MSLEFTGKICPTCRGSGESRHKEDDYTCPQCDGEGYIAETVRISKQRSADSWQPEDIKHVKYK